MEELIAEKIDVEQAATSPRPVRFTWRKKVYEVAEVLQVRVDTGFGGLPPRSRRWFTRRHRRYYVVKDSQGHVFEMYLDYSNRKKLSWWLTKRRPRGKRWKAGTEL